MKKVLLIGELNETLHSLSECMSASFKVQMCSVNANDIKDMIRIIRPAILVINVYDISEETKEVFNTLKERYNHMSIAVIGNAETEEQFEQILKNFSKALFLKRPIAVKDVLESCLGLLNMDEEKQSADEERDSTTQNITRQNITTQDVRHRIMVVDDNALVLRKVKKMLENDYEVSIVNSGEKALKLLEKNNPELVLLDYDMPGMNGKQMYEKMKENEATRSIPVVFLTSVAQKNRTIEILKSQPAGYILKPPVKEKLYEAIREVLGE